MATVLKEMDVGPVGGYNPSWLVMDLSYVFYEEAAETMRP